MRSSVSIVLSLLSAASIGAAAVLLLEPAPVRSSTMKGKASEPPEFRWGEGSEASVVPAKVATEP